MRARLLLLFTLATTCLSAQYYQVQTNQPDSFSQALVRTLQCAVNRFRDCQGDSIRYTWPGGTYFQLQHHFPGSTAEVITGTTYDRNVYIEFRGFPDTAALRAGTYQLVNRIKKALGAQLYDPNSTDTSSTLPYFYMMSIQDQQGFFSSNIELFSGRSRHTSYLLTSENTPANGPETNFILLKIHGGVPNYQFYIKPVAPVNPPRYQLFSQLLQAAKQDFDPLRTNRLNAKGKPRKVDTLLVNNFTVRMSYHGNYAAEWLFETGTDSLQLQKEWQSIQTDLQAALGTDYLYSISNWANEPSVVFFKRSKNGDEPRIYIHQNKKTGSSYSIQVRIESGITHPTSAGLTDDDFD